MGLKSRGNWKVGICLPTCKCMVCRKKTRVKYNKTENMICPVCKKEFVGKVTSRHGVLKKQIYCSKQCSGFANASIIKPTYLQCTECGEMFKSRNLTRKQYCSRKCFISARTGEKNWLWMGDKVGKIALHCWVKRRLSKPKLCQHCGKVPPYDLANISQKYKRDLSDWIWLCRRCHVFQDGRNIKLNRDANGRFK